MIIDTMWEMKIIDIVSLCCGAYVIISMSASKLCVTLSVVHALCTSGVYFIMAVLVFIVQIQYIIPV